ncbi:MAG: TlpA family protein disulfide reductase, partial [Phycisphaerae bacterium]|nr:TlpA family protein disulfide reductase [Phycisphaerae bacterium]
ALAVPTALTLTARAENKTEKTDPKGEKTTTGKFLATLPNGVTVELVALWKGLNKDDRQWWRPDGTVMTQTQYAPYEQKITVRFRDLESGNLKFEYGYAYRVTPAKEVSTETDVMAGMLSRHSYVDDRDGFGLAAASSVSKYEHKMVSVGTGDIKIAAAHGPWQRIIPSGCSAAGPSGRFKINDMRSLKGGSSIIITGPRSVKTNPNEEFMIDATVNAGDVDIRLLYELKTGGGIRKANRSGRMGGPSIESFFRKEKTMIKRSFRVPANVDLIKQIIVEYRKYQCATFKNVSLKPGQKTNVQIQPRPKPPTPQPEKAAAEANRVVRKRMRLVMPGMQFDRMRLNRLKDVLQHLRNVSNCPIHVKWAALEKMGITRDSKVDVRLTNVTMDKAIRTILDVVAGPGKLGFVVSGGVITISTQADLDRATPPATQPARESKVKKETKTLSGVVVDESSKAFAGGTVSSTTNTSVPPPSTPKTAADVLAKMAEARGLLRSATYKIERQVHFVNEMRTDARPPEKGVLVVAAGTRALHKERFVVSGAKYRHDEDGIIPYVSDKGGLVPFRRFVAYDGKTKRTYNVFDGRGSMRRKHLTGYPASLAPLFHFHWGLHTMSKAFRVDALKLVGKKRNWKGRPCYVLVEEVGAMRNEYYVVPQYDWALVSLSMKVVAPDKEVFWNDTTMKWVGTGLRDLEFEIAYKKDICGLWLPAGWVVRTYRGWGKDRKPHRFHTVRVKKAKSNVNVPDSTFAIRFPDGTRVSDRDRGVSVKWDNSLGWKELDARLQRKADKIEQRNLERRLRTESKLKVGDAAPLFEARTIDGKRVRLADLRGKYVLLAFWGGGGNTSRRETPFLKAAYERGRKDPRFAMVSVTNNHERIVKRTTEWVARSKVKWAVTFMEIRLSGALRAKYGCSNAGWIFLIGPDGKVIARNLRGDGIKAAVAKALSAAGLAKVDRETLPAATRPGS